MLDSGCSILEKSFIAEIAVLGTPYGENPPNGVVGKRREFLPRRHEYLDADFADYANLRGFISHKKAKNAQKTTKNDQKSAL